MIIIRLVLHNRNIQRALGTSTGVRGLYRAIITMLVESYALYAATLLLYVIPLAANSTVSNIFVDALGGAQVSTFVSFPRRTAILGSYHLTVSTHRSLPLFS